MQKQVIGWADFFNNKKSLQYGGQKTAARDSIENRAPAFGPGVKWFFWHEMYACNP